MLTPPPINYMMKNSSIECVHCGPDTVILHYKAIQEAVSECVQCNTGHVDGEDEKRELLVRVSCKAES